MASVLLASRREEVLPPCSFLQPSGVVLWLFLDIPFVPLCLSCFLCGLPHDEVLDPSIQCVLKKGSYLIFFLGS